MLVNLKAALAARRVRQVDLSIAPGISASVFSEIVNGRRTPSKALRERIAGELGAEESWLFVSHTNIPGPRNLSMETAPALCAAGRE